MIHFVFKIILCFSLFAIFSCEKENILTNTDNIPVQMRLSFVNSSMGSMLDFGDSIYSHKAISPAEMRIYHFDKRKFSNYSKIFFTGFFDYRKSDNEDSFIIDLYNVTDDIPIDGSSISISDSTLMVNIYISKVTILERLPDKEITIAMRLKRPLPTGDLKKPELIIE